MKDIRRFISLAILAVSFAFACAQPTAAQSTGAFTRLGFDARGMSLGNALVADVSGHASPYYNPALAPELTGQHFGLSAAYMRLDRQLQSVQFGAPLRPRAGVALGFVHAGVSRIDGRDNSGFHTGDLSTDEFALYMAFGIRLTDTFTGGITLQLFRSDLLPEVDAVNSIGLDLGFTMRATDNLTFGLVVEDLLAKYDWDTSGAFGGAGKTTADNFPRRIRFGSSFANAASRLRLNAEIEVSIETLEARETSVELLSGIPVERVTTETLYRTNSQLRVGASWALTEIFEVQGGIDRIGPDPTSDAAPTAGFVVTQPLGNLRLRAGYAFVLEPMQTGAMHVLTLRVFL